MRRHGGDEVVWLRPLCEAQRFAKEVASPQCRATEVAMEAPEALVKEVLLALLLPILDPVLVEVTEEVAVVFSSGKEVHRLV